MKKKLINNVLTGFVGQIILLALGLVVPRIMIVNYGSDLNGLLGTITQIFSYMALLEAGISQATRNALFQPIAQNDKSSISYIVSLSQRYFRRMTLYYGVGVIALCVVCPFLIKTNVDGLTVSLIILFEGMSGVFSFYHIQTIRATLMADGKSYICNMVNVLNKALSYAIRIVMALLGINIVYIQIAYFFITISIVVFYKIYFRKHYSYINYNAAPIGAKLKDRNSYVLTELAWMVFSSTDMIVLSIFVSTSLSSVYSVYNMIFANLSVVVSTVYHSVNYLLGQTYHKNLAQYPLLHDSFTSFFVGLITAMMSTANIMIEPFLRLYTAGITDVNYIISAVPTLFCLVQMFSWSRYVSGNLTGVSGYARQVSKISVVEAMLNIILSVCFVRKYGVKGVLLATVIALPIKLIYCIFISDIKVLKRSAVNSIKILGCNYLIFFISCIAKSRISIFANDYLAFILEAAVVFLIFGTITVVFNVLANPKSVLVIRRIIRK